MRSGLLALPGTSEKSVLRELHWEAVGHCVERSRPGPERHEDRLLSLVAAGHEVHPERIRPRLVLVRPGSEDELPFRYARLHWSVPVSAGYGRRLRFVVYDDSNGKLIGIFGLGDPVFSLGPRDLWTGWNLDSKKARLQCVMDLFMLGAVPPYSDLLCGKLIVLLATSREVQRAFRRRNDGKKAFISHKRLDGRLALVTTTSALGRSSPYNRLRYGGEPVFQSVGFTRGSGEFQFSNGLYEELRRFAVERCDGTAKHARWGNGFRNRRELVSKALPLLGLSRELVYHGVQREIFVAPLASNSAARLVGGGAMRTDSWGVATLDLPISSHAFPGVLPARGALRRGIGRRDVEHRRVRSAFRGRSAWGPRTTGTCRPSAERLVGVAVLAEDVCHAKAGWVGGGSKQVSAGRMLYGRLPEYGAVRSAEQAERLRVRRRWVAVTCFPPELLDALPWRGPALVAISLHVV